MEYITSFKLWALHSSVYTYPYDSKRSYSKTLVKSIHLSNSRERTMKYMRAIDESLDTVWPIKNLCLSRTCSKASIRWWLRRKLLRERLFFSFSFLRCTNSSRREEALAWIIIYITYISVVYIINTLNTWEKTWSRACVDWLSSDIISITFTKI